VREVAKTRLKSSLAGVFVIAQIGTRRWTKRQMLMPNEPRSGGIDVSPGREPGVKIEELIESLQGRHRFSRALLTYPASFHPCSAAPRPLSKPDRPKRVKSMSAPTSLASNPDSLTLNFDA